MQIQSYNDIVVRCLQFPSYPDLLVGEACGLTMNKTIYDPPICGKKMLRFLIKAEHTSVLEHCFWTFYIEGISRSCLAQITRHRMGSFTSASQHYATYDDMPMVVEDPSTADASALEHSLNAYVTAIRIKGASKEEARQLLPNACAVNLMWTVNARSLLNFFRLRLCQRNCKEIQILTEKIRVATKLYWRDFGLVAGPPCWMDGKCNQGKMSCGIVYDRQEEEG